MRITNSTVLRNYDRNLKRLSTNKYNSEQKIFTGREFCRASENPLNAAKVFLDHLFIPPAPHIGTCMGSPIIKAKGKGTFI